MITRYSNPASASASPDCLSPAVLLKFLVAGVSRISDYRSWRAARGNLAFAATFRLRPHRGEAFLFSLDNWPLGVHSLQYCQPS